MDNPVELYTAIGIRIRQERERRDLTQEELAGRSGIGRTSLTNIEAGRQRLLVHQLWRIARALSVQPRGLFPDLQSVKAKSVEELLASVPKNDRDFVAQVVRRGRRHGKAKSASD